MGTSMTFYSIQNRSLSVEGLIAGLAALDKALIATEEKINERLRCLGVDDNLLIKKHDEPIVAYNESSKWLPLFQENMCADCNPSTQDIDELSRYFGAPVIAFSIFDSDVLYLSYTDSANGIAFAYERANDEELESCEVPEHPEFLEAFCDEGKHRRLRDIWESAEYYMADNRMWDMCEILGIDLIYVRTDIPKGYSLIQPNRIE